MKNQIRTKTIIGKIPYTNSLPFYFDLKKEDGSEFDYYEAVPTKINLAMRRGKIAIAPVSSLEYLNHQKDYLLLPDLVIGARDFSASVLLFSKERIEGLNGATIGLTRQSLSSATLLRILMRYKYKFKNRFVSVQADPEEMLRRHTAALVIGDDALFFRSREFFYKYDLSELWWNWTGRPFCFALWAVRRDFAKRNPEELSEFYRNLKGNLKKNLSNLEALLNDALGLTFLNENFPKVFGYLFNLSFGLDESMREGLQHFYRLAWEMGVSPEPKPLEFAAIQP